MTTSSVLKERGRKFLGEEKTYAGDSPVEGKTFYHIIGASGAEKSHRLYGEENGRRPGEGTTRPRERGHLIRSAKKGQQRVPLAKESWVSV